MKKKTKICLGIILVIFLIIGLFVYKNWNTINAMIDAILYSQETVEGNLQQHKDELQKILDENENITVREMTPEEIKALNDGTMTEEEVIAKMTGQDAENIKSPQVEEPPPKNQTTQKPSSSTPATEAPKTSEQIVSELVAKLYILENNYLNKLDDIEAQATAEFQGEVRANHILLPEQGALKKRMLPKYLPKVSAWEKECDSYVYGVIDEIAAELKKNGKEDTITSELKESYLQKKRAKKAYFINRYMD